MADPEEHELNSDADPNADPNVDPNADPNSDPNADPVEPVTEPEPKPDPLETQLQEERERRIRLEERLAAKEEAPAPVVEEPPKELTRQQLSAAVSEGSIDEDQKEEIWATQQRNAHRRDTEELLSARDKQRDATNIVEDQTKKFIEANPDVLVEGSSIWKKVKTEYDFYTSVGDPHNKTTELKALRSALGNPTRIRERTADLRETLGETSGSTGEHGSRPVDIWNRVPEKYRSYHKGKVDRREMTLKEVEDLIPYMQRCS
jgi:hypothetical protein